MLFYRKLEKVRGGSKRFNAIAKSICRKMLAKTNSNNIKINILGDISKLDISLQKA